MIQCWCENPSEYSMEEIRSACEDWASTYDEALTTEKLQITRTDPPDGTEHLQGYWRFAWHEDGTELLDALVADMEPYVSWAVVKRHACDHDESADAQSGCSWDDTREFGEVPL